MSSSNRTKIVINTSFGGFGLSTEATRRYLDLCGTPYVEKVRAGGDIAFYVGGEGERNYYYISGDNMSLRSDPRLVQVVEELGKKANGFCADLEIVELEKGTLYRISEYDGAESIELASKQKWLTA